MGSRKIVTVRPPETREMKRRKAEAKALTADSPSVKRGAANLMRAARATR